MRRAFGVVVMVLALGALYASSAGASGHGDKVIQLKLFQSPSHNIGCAMLKTGVRCDIGEHSWVAPPKPKSCDLDFGNGLVVGKGRAAFACAGDTTLHQGKVLPYGKSQHLGHVSCTSLVIGMRCENHNTHHGFLLSRSVAHRF